MKLDTDIRHVSDGHCWKGYRGSEVRSKLEVTGQGHMFTYVWCYNGGGIHFNGLACRLTCFI